MTSSQITAQARRSAPLCCVGVTKNVGNSRHRKYDEGQLTHILCKYTFIYFHMYIQFLWPKSHPIAAKNDKNILIQQ